LLFDGTLGDWKTKPVSFQLKEGVSPYHGRAFPVPKVHKETIIKEVERLCQLGVLERQPASEWALPSFIIPKKDKTICFLSDFLEVNKRLVRKPFPIPKISMVLQEIEGFSYATTLDLNMGYYTIIGSRCIQNLHHYISLGKVLLQETTNGYCRFSRHFLRKDVGANGILSVRAYLDNLLCISKLSLENHLEKLLEEVLRQLRDAGLKVDAAKSTFCALEIEYLGYVLTRDGIKPQSNKVQAILAIKPPTGVRQLRHFVGMVQYYRDLWARRSEMLAPLTSLVGECAVRPKPLKLKGPRRYPGIGTRSIKEHLIT
jgi:hypothetical protein